MDQLERVQNAEAELQTLDEHEIKVIELIDWIGDLRGETSQNKRNSDSDILPLSRVTLLRPC